MLFVWVTKKLLLIAVGAIKIYQAVISPYFPASCKFSPCCSEFAVRVLVRFGLKKAVCLVGARLLRCQPFYKRAGERNKNE